MPVKMAAATAGAAQVPKRRRNRSSIGIESANPATPKRTVPPARSRPSASDSRRMELRVTAAGREVFGKIVPLLAERERRMVAALSEAERRQFGALLMKVAQKVPDWAVPELSALAPAGRATPAPARRRTSAAGRTRA